MSKEVNSSLIISTYNWPQALQLCLYSVMQQHVLPSEVIIADDGSGEETFAIIEHFKPNFPVPLIHCWHHDDGFKLAQIRNKAMAIAKGEYIIQIDGDIILHPFFIKDHLHIAEENHFVTGSRILLNEKTTRSLFIENKINYHFLQRKGKNFFNRLRFVFLQDLLSKRYKTRGKHLYDVKGCNMAFWKKDIIRVNGYDESFTGWGREDSDIAIRLINAGVQKKFLKFGGIQYHLYHKEADRNSLNTNNMRMVASVENKTTSAKLGIKQYL